MHAAETQAIMLTLWKDLRSAEKVVVLALWSCASLHPHALWWSCTQFLSWCLDCWAGSERFASALFQLRSGRQRGLEVYPSIWENSALLESLEVCQWPGELEMQRRELHTLRFWRFVRILPDDFSLRRLLANVSVRHELSDLFFVISETNTFRQGKVVIIKQKCFIFLIKDALVELAFFSILYSWQWPHKGLIKLN